ncbi:hypothetical protein FSP39_024257 [Pinctada imbricata]|uniref:Hflx-type G domain-containing protein n=1 Tax=Pinctada imbricata TaxID=66713 RepID=A0AA88YRJ4_PINIB|nr:hypothetical protein FSP39_024257 [Pinctada imbricata]
MQMIYPVGENRQFIFGKRQMTELTGFIRVNRQKITAVFLNVDILKINQLALFKNTWRVPVFDRYSIVLQIFKEHANTKIAKIQVALAELPYLSSGTAGGGHTPYKAQPACMAKIATYNHVQQIFEHDRRERKLRAALEKLKQHRNLLWNKRQRKDVPTIAIVGYTNSGKTTLIKALTGDERVEPCNQLFATLDVTVHAGRLDNHMTVLFIDTIGFISNLPMDLLSVFSATLQDALLADVILHVRDISHPDSEAQYANVMSTLRNILPPEKMENVVVVCNKTDLIGDPSNEKGSDNEDMFISAVTGLGLDDLKNKLQTSLLQSCDLLEKKFRVPFDGEHLRYNFNNPFNTCT